MIVERQQGITEQLSLFEQVGSVLRPVDFGEVGSGSKTNGEQQAFTAVAQRRALTQDLMDRLVQQAIQQVLEPILDTTFSLASHGIRPVHNAYTALNQAQDHVPAGHAIVVDKDLEKFFDRVNNDVLMGRLSRWIGDRRLLRIISRFLEAGMLQQGVKIRRVEGTPQGGPLMLRTQ